MSNIETRRQLADARTGRERLFGEIENLKARAQVDGESDGIAERLGNLNRGVQAADDRIADLEQQLGRYAELERMAADPKHLEMTEQPAERRDTGPRSETRDKALKTIERHADVMDDGRPDELERFIRRSTVMNEWVARYLTAVGDPAYRSAFGKMMADPQNGHLRFSPAEVEAVRVASQVEAERALSVGTGSAGGFAVPFDLDPTIILTSSGALNPVRQLARVVTISGNEWRGVASDGVVSTYRAEGAVMADNSPTLVQPTILTRRWDSFVPYSWEVGADWPAQGLQNELTRLISDAQNVNDAAVFFGGTSSSNQPTGLMTSLGTSQQVITGSTATLVAADVWALKAAVPTRWQPNTTFAAPTAMVDRIYRLTPSGATTEPQLMTSRDSALVGRPVAEWSFNAGTSVATGGTLAIAGDFSNYVIADRLGLTAIPIPVLFSGNTAGGFGYPTGQSGLAVWGRTGANCVNVNAFRVLTSR
jgi:HK97 family phage major capsid protein